MLNNFWTIPVIREKTELRLAFAIPASAPTPFANKIIQTPLLATLKTIKVLSM